MKILGYMRLNSDKSFITSSPDLRRVVSSETKLLATIQGYGTFLPSKGNAEGFGYITPDSVF
jgi:hypothetical protein